MKRTYQSPSMAEVNVEAAQMLAASAAEFRGTIETTDADNRNEWGSIWNKN